MYLSTSALLVLVGGWVTSFFLPLQGWAAPILSNNSGVDNWKPVLKKNFHSPPPPPPPRTLWPVPYRFHHHSFIIHHQWLIFPFPRFQSWAMDPSFWIGSMDHLYGSGPRTHGPPVMDRVHVPLKRKKIKTEKWTINKMQINIVQQYYSFNDKLRDKFWVSQSFWFVTWTQNMDPGSMDPPLWTGSMETFCLRSWK